jgi:hypothetical protein
MYTLAPKSNLVVHSLGLGYDPGPTNAKHGMDKGMDKLLIIWAYCGDRGPRLDLNSTYLDVDI